MALVELRQVMKTYSDGQSSPVTALQATDLLVGPGEFVCLAGPSGAGKTTLLNMIGCIDRPTSGRILIEEKDTATLGRGQLAKIRRRAFGFVFQSFNLIPVLNAYENVEYVLLLQNVEADERRQRVNTALASVGLSRLMDKRPGQLSGGQQQRVAAARAIVSRPLVVLADEPTANLDSKTGEELIDLFAALKQQLQTTFVFSSHDPAVIRRAQRILTLRDGRIMTDERLGG
ncbi:MAG: ABC transporter ATP-binding protein [Deltaproteobacteria bacterium]|nr:ABC transporter ATP-binding protein [Deltaproteobacteria bacterium]